MDAGAGGLLLLRRQAQPADDALGPQPHRRALGVDGDGRGPDGHDVISGLEAGLRTVLVLTGSRDRPSGALPLPARPRSSTRSLTSSSWSTRGPTTRRRSSDFARSAGTSPGRHDGLQVGSRGSHPDSLAAIGRVPRLLYWLTPAERANPGTRGRRVRRSRRGTIHESSALVRARVGHRVALALTRVGPAARRAPARCPGPARRGGGAVTQRLAMAAGLQVGPSTPPDRSSGSAGRSYFAANPYLAQLRDDKGVDWSYWRRRLSRAPRRRRRALRRPALADRRRRSRSPRRTPTTSRSRPASAARTTPSPAPSGSTRSASAAPGRPSRSTGRCRCRRSRPPR